MDHPKTFPRLVVKQANTSLLLLQRKVQPSAVDAHIALGAIEIVFSSGHWRCLGGLLEGNAESIQESLTFYFVLLIGSHYWVVWDKLWGMFVVVCDFAKLARVSRTSGCDCVHFVSFPCGFVISLLIVL